MDAHTLLPLAVPPLSLLQTLERSYLLRLHGKVVERPQHMLMRVAIGIHLDDIEEAVKTYHLLRCAAVAGVPCCQRLAASASLASIAGLVCAAGAAL
jgi:hypothetical protein